MASVCAGSLALMDAGTSPTFLFDTVVNLNRVFFSIFPTCCNYFYYNFI